MGTGGITLMNVNDYFKYINMGLPEDIRRLKDAGYYDEAMRLMDIKAARPDTPEELKYCFLAWKEIFRRIPREYSLPWTCPYTSGGSCHRSCSSGCQNPWRRNG